MNTVIVLKLSLLVLKLIILLDAVEKHIHIVILVKQKIIKIHFAQAK